MAVSHVRPEGVSAAMPLKWEEILACNWERGEPRLHQALPAKLQRPRPEGA